MRLKRYATLLMTATLLLCSTVPVYAAEVDEEVTETSQITEDVVKTETELETRAEASAGYQQIQETPTDGEPDPHYEDVDWTKPYVSVGETCIYDGTTVNNIEGVSYNADTSTMTLTDYQCTITTDDPDCFIYCRNLPVFTICLAGENEINLTTGEYGIRGLITYYSDSSDPNGGLLKITGEGSLDINIEGDSATAILTGNNEGFLMDSGTLNIHADVKSGFYGISSNVNMYMPRAKGKLFEILGGSISIDCEDMPQTVNYDGYNYPTYAFGIDSQDRDLVIKDAEVNISLGTSAFTCAIGCGLLKDKYQDGNTVGAYRDGGTFTVDNAIVRLKTGESAPGYDEKSYIYDFVNSGNELIYVGKNSANRLVKPDAAFRERVIYSNFAHRF